MDFYLGDAASAQAVGARADVSILGGLVMISGYDLLRNVLPIAWLKRVWVQEHVIKMMGAYIAVTSAAAGTIFPNLLPWAAVIPSTIGTAVAWGFVIVGPRAWGRGVERPVGGTVVS